MDYDELPGVGEWANDVRDYPLSQDPLTILLEREESELNV